MNYTTYYTRGQRVFLINADTGRDQTCFEGFSATIAGCDNDLFELRPRYPLNHGQDRVVSAGMLYKVTAESYGSGVQFLGRLSHVNGGLVRLKPEGAIEMYQRSQVPRSDLLVSYKIFTRTAPLAVFQHEWRRLQQGLTPAAAARIDLQSGQLNLGMGGLSYMVAQSEPQSDLAMAVIMLQPDSVPICAVAEQLWRRTLPDGSGSVIGRRFVQITKHDQKRIEQHLQQLAKQTKKKIKPAKTNWELLDKMLHDQR